MRSAKSFLLLASLLLIAGCGPLSTPVGPVTPDKPDVTVEKERATAGDVFVALAHAVEAKQIDSSQQLAKFIVVLVRNGDLSADDATRFDAAFPGIVKTDRPLTDADAATLKGLK
jgi:predicted small lipoprotein YifL